MKKKNSFQLLIACFLALGFLSIQAFAQDVYVLREQKASPQVKQRLTSLRNRIQQRKLTFQVGYTFPREKGVEKLTGGKKPNVSVTATRKQNALAAQLIQIDNEARLAARVPQIKFACSANLKSWDWRRDKKVSPVKQQKCGNCWAYAASAAFESSYLIQTGKTIDTSEQYIVSNNDNGAGNCESGYASSAIDFIVVRGTTLESILPDSGTNGTADPNMDTPYSGVVWGWVNPDNAGNPGVQSIKQALCEHGPVATWIDAGGTFGDYTGGVYNDDDDKETGYTVLGHFVTIIGWDDATGAWLIKNSWGTTWGETAGSGTERGYGWVKYGTHQIGSWVSWIKARGAGYVLPKRYYEMMPTKRIPKPDLLNNKQNPITKP